MIRFEGRMDEYAYRMSDAYLDSTVTQLEEGQWVTFNAAGNLVVADGTECKAFLALSSIRPGRNNVSGVPVKKATFLHGAFMLKVSNFDTGVTYEDKMTPLKLKAGGVLTKWASPADDAVPVVAYAKGKPMDGYLTIFSA